MNTLVILKATSGDLRGQQFAISGPANCVVGRSRSCGLRLPSDPTVSRQHCIIEIESQGAWIQDLGSLNGTHVNGSRIGSGDRVSNDATMHQPLRWELHDGDEVRVCNNVFDIEVVAPQRSSPSLRLSGSVAL